MKALSRRAVLGTAAAATAPIGAVTVPGRTHLDAELLAACAAFDRLERAFIATDHSCLAGSPADLIASVERERIEAEQEPLVDKIADLQATTLQGLIARARSLAIWDGELFRDNGPSDPGSLFTQALVRDLLALA